MKFKTTLQGIFLSIAACLTLICLYSTSVSAAASFSVAPGILKFDLIRPKTQPFLVKNNGDERIRIIIKPIYFALGSRFFRAGEPISAEDATGDTTNDDLTSYILLSPRVLSLKPGQRRTVRISIRPPSTLTPGDYRGHLLIRTLEGKPKTVRQTRRTADGKEISINLKIKLETAIAVYGRVGEPEIKLEWECRQNEEGILELLAINRSAWMFKGWVGAYDSGKGENSDPLDVGRVISFRESKRPITLKAKPLPKLMLRWGEEKDNLDMGRTDCTLKKLPSLDEQQ